MQIEQIVALLVAERDRLSMAITALQEPAKRGGRSIASTPRTNPPAAAGKARPKRKLSAAGRKAIADAAKRRWAAIKAGKAPSPFRKNSSKK